MKRKLKAKSSIYSFLKEKGVLENGKHEEIQNVRKEYWNKYKREWRNEKRKKEKEFTISLDRDELKELSNEAKRHRRSRTRFIKEACFAYINKSFIVPDKIEVMRISQLLAMTYNTIFELFKENKVSSEIGRSLLESIKTLEREVLPLLHHPIPIEEYIRLHIKKCSRNKKEIVDLINSL